MGWPGKRYRVLHKPKEAPEQVEGWIDAAGLPLTERDLDAISKLITESGAGEGPTRPPRS